MLLEIKIFNCAHAYLSVLLTTNQKMCLDIFSIFLVLLALLGRELTTFRLKFLCLFNKPKCACAMLHWKYIVVIFIWNLLIFIFSNDDKIFQIFFFNSRIVQDLLSIDNPSDLSSRLGLQRSAIDFYQISDPIIILHSRDVRSDFWRN